MLRGLVLTNDHEIPRRPVAWSRLMEDTRAQGFAMGSEPETGSLLATLAASKPGGRLLELGTGTGLGTAWILAGMDPESLLTTVENDPKVLTIARKHLEQDPRITFCLEDGSAFLERVKDQRFDFIFADTWPGKYTHLDEALRLLKDGGLYIVDDLIPLPGWPPEHGPKVPHLIARLQARPDLCLTQLHWATGLIIATRIKGASSCHSTMGGERNQG